MKTAQEVENMFRSKGKGKGGILFLTPIHAIELVRECRKENLGILGIDGFKLSENSTQPLMGYSLDFSAEKKRSLTDKNWDEAEQFLQEHLFSGLFFEVIID